MIDVIRQFENAIRITEYDREAGKILRKPLGLIACDSETTGLLFHTPSYFKDEEKWVDNPFPFGFSFAFKHKGEIVLIWGRYGSRLYGECKRILTTPNIKTWHNSKYDRRICRASNIETGGSQHCTLTMSRIHWDRRKDHRLQALGEMLWPELSDWEVSLNDEKKKLKAYWTRTVKEEDIWLPEGIEPDEYFNYSFLPDKLIGRYAMVDAFVGYQLYVKLAPIMQNQFKELYSRERKIISCVIKIEETGMGFDVARGRMEIEKNAPLLEKSENTVTRMAEKFYKPIREAAEERYEGIKSEHVLKHFPDQAFLKQLRKDKKLKWAFGPEKILDMLLRLGIKKKQLTERGNVTTNADVLHRCLKEEIPAKAKRFINSLLDYRALAKVTNTYLKPLTLQAERTGGTVYTTINPTSTRTGRPCSTDPNLLNIPNPTTTKSQTENAVRSCFVPRPGNTIYYFDVAQQEYAVLLLYCEEMELLEAYMNGSDIHQTMADKMGMDRKRCKNLNFGITYGLSTKGMALLYGMTIAQAKEDRELYNDIFPFVKDFQDRCECELRQYGYVEDFFGRRYHLHPNQAYKAVNALIQGGCAQAFKIGLLNVQELLIKQVNILLPVYDEIQLERPTFPKAKYEKYWCHCIIEAMIDIPQLLDRGLRLRVDVEKSTTNWAEKEKVVL